jgi:uncharacterized protein (DUF1330 family)
MMERIMAAYLVAVCEVTNANDNFKEYSKRSAQILAKYGGKYIVRGRAAQVIKGGLFNGKVVIITEFPSLDDFNRFFNDKEYQDEVVPLREGTGNYEFAVYESDSKGP